MSVFRFLFKGRSLQFKFSVMTVLPLMLAAVLMGGLIIHSVKTSMERKSRTAAEGLLRMTALSMSSAHVIYNKVLLDSFVDSLTQCQDILFAAVVDAGDSRVLSQNRHEGDGSFFDASELAREAASADRGVRVGDIEIMSQSIDVGGQKYGDLVIGYSKAGGRREAAIFRGEALTIVGTAALIGLLVAIGLSRYVSRPIKVMASQAQRIGAGEALHAIVYDGSDAIGRLADSFNRMVENLQDRQAQLLTINRIADKLHQSLDWDTVISNAVDILAEYSGSPSVALFVLDENPELLRLAHNRGFGEDVQQVSATLPVAGSLSGLAVKERDIVESFDILHDERVPEAVRKALGASGFRGVVCLPLLFKEEIMGVVNFIYKEPFSLPRSKRATHMAVGRTIALALANAKYVSRIEKEIAERERAEVALMHTVQEMSALNTLARNAGRHLSVDQVAKATVESLVSSLNNSMILFFLKEGDSLLLKEMHNSDVALEVEGVDIHRVGDCLCGICADEGNAVFSPDIFSDPRCTRSECKNAMLRSFVALPLLNGENVIGLLCLASRDGYDYSRDSGFLETVSRQASVSLVNAMLHEQIQGQAAELERRVIEQTAELNVAMQKAQEADQIKSAFLASMSHELRTPLNSIIGFTGILLQGLAGGLNEEQGKQMRMVQNSARHLLRLINDVLDISKIEAGQLDLAFERFDLGESLRGVVRIVTPLADKKGLALLTDIAPEIGEIYSDKRRIEQVLLNLINNAIKFTDSGRIYIRSKVERSHVVTSVTDTGIGIRKEDMGALFEAFRQIHTGVARRYEGTGLGLSICKRLVEMLGGEIWVDSRGEGRGSTFAFSLPLPDEGGNHEAQGSGNRG